MIENITDQLTRHGSLHYRTRTLDQIQGLIIHHTAAPATVGPRQIARYHVQALNWAGIGYHFIVKEDGVIQQVNSISTVSNHLAGDNTRWIGIALLGSFCKGYQPPVAQLTATARVCAKVLLELKLPYRNIQGHKERMFTTCPGDTWDTPGGWKSPLLMMVKERMRQ